MAQRLKTMADIAGLIGYHTATDASKFTLDGNSKVSQWQAKYGSTVINQPDPGRRLTYSASVASIGNKPAMQFGPGCRMDFADASKFPANGAGHTVLLLYRGTINKQNIIILSWGSETGNWRLTGYGNSGTNTWAAMPTGDHSSSNSALNTTSLMVHAVGAGANPTSTHYVNGGVGGMQVMSGTNNNGATAAAIGYTSFYDAFDAEGVILEGFAVFTGELSASDRDDAEGILAWDHGQQGQLVADHPYKSAAPMVDDGVADTVTGSSASTLAGVGAVSTAALAIVGAASLALAGIGSTSTSSAPIAAQAQAPLGAIVSAGAGGISVAGAGVAALQSISASGAGTLAVLAVGTTSLGDVTSSESGTLPIASTVSSTLGPVGTVSAARADVRGTASTSLGSIIGSATAGGQSLATASSASVLGSISTAATGLVPVVGTGSTTLAPIASNSGSASAVRGAGAASLGAVVSSSASSIPIGAIGSANLDTVRADGRGGSIASATAASALGAIVGAASATVGQDTDSQLVGPGWMAFATPRQFIASAIRRSFIVSSTGCKSMLKFPRKYAHEIRYAAVDFAPALADGEELVGEPIVTVARGDLVVADQRVDGSTVRFTLSGGTAARSFYQSIEIHCATSGGQVLEEIVSVTMAS